MTRISFVVPAYNAASFISKCLDSLILQSLNEFECEILVINDGSTDATADVVCEYVKRFSNISLINQENKGLAETRNIGIANSNGRFIWFIDSDDFIAENCANELLRFAETNDLDMFLVAPAIPVTKDFKADWKTNIAPIVIRGKTLLERGGIDVGVWAYIYKRSFIEMNNLRFLSGYLFEDSEFTPRALYYARNVGVLNFNVYHYIQHDKSIMHTFSPKRLSHYIAIAVSLEQFRKGNCDDLVVQRFFSSAAVGFVLAGFKAIAMHNLSRQHLKNYVSECRFSGLLPLRQIDAGLSRSVVIILASIFPALYIKLLRWKRLVLGGVRG